MRALEPALPTAPKLYFVAQKGVFAHCHRHNSPIGRHDMAANWAPDSWTRHEARQLPTYPDAAALTAATDQLASWSTGVIVGFGVNQQFFEFGWALGFKVH